MQPPLAGTFRHGAAACLRFRNLSTKTGHIADPAAPQAYGSSVLVSRVKPKGAGMWMVSPKAASSRRR